MPEYPLWRHALPDGEVMTAQDQPAPASCPVVSALALEPMWDASAE